eukprot:TRINITY_DN3113_c0_g1_i2.p1 TRINITY_DN3113_c0_g1~~TRINITY_DN3113_c0_g1_i2.p1  ORF type:complete len:340 (+),score=80.03 TRINITY_DN3113_c0_g1_i2:33-1052(+)
MGLMGALEWLLTLGGLVTLQQSIVLLSFLLLLILSAFGVSIFTGVQRHVSLLLPDEKFYIDASTQSRVAFPAPFSEPETAKDNIYLSVIFPAYNEEQRMPATIQETIEYLKQRSKKDSKFTWEIIIVDDGSRDATFKLAMEFSKKEGADRVRVLKLVRNRGKGGAVKCGAFVARGRYILMADSDNATQFSDVEKLEAACAKVERDGLCVGVGSRAHLEETAVAERTVFRNILMWGFHFLVRFVGGIHGIKDTQCGFKMFSRKAAALLFPSQHVERWCFDIELLYLASHFRIPAVEVAVRWEEIAGSKLDPMSASAQMARDLFRIRLFYLLGFWKIEKLE